MAKDFGKRLVEDLNALKDDMRSGFPFSRNRPDSTGSDSLSIRSLLSNPGSKPDILADATRRVEHEARRAAKPEARRAVKPEAKRAVKPEARATAAKAGPSNSSST